MGAEGSFRVESNRPVAEGIYRMELSGDASAFRASGQFANFAVEGAYLRRPLSASDYHAGGFAVIYKVVGDGTRRLSGRRAGDALNALVGLGNGFDDTVGERPILLGGGMGAAPLYALAKALLKRGARPAAILGFSRAAEVICAEELSALGVPASAYTLDGSAGRRGLVTEGLDPEAGDALYACGPEAMLRAACDRWPGDAQLSFEARMGCGFGACMGCGRKTLGGMKRICKDGPVLWKSEVAWEG